MKEEMLEKSSIIGRTESDLKKYGEKGTAYIGKVVLSSGENPVLGRKILMDVAKPHLVLICGKRGGGKSYSMAVLLEELARQPREIRNRLSIITIDTVGIFWTLKIPNSQEKAELYNWDLSPDKTDAQVLVPKGKIDFYKEKQLPVDGTFTIKTSELDDVEWLALFQLTWKDPEGVALSKAIESLKDKIGTLYDIKEIILTIQKDTEIEKKVKDAVINRLKVAQSWGIFEKEGTKIKDIAKPGVLTVIDVSA